MGYDMTWEYEPQEVLDAKGKAFPPEGGISREDLERWGSLQRQAGSYYRLNIWGMGEMRQLLYAGDAMSTKGWDSGPPPEVSADTGGVLPAYKVGSNDGWLVSPTECKATALAWFEGGGRAKAEEMAATLAEDWSSPEEPATAEDVLRFADEFVLWMAEAANHGGFRVW